MFRCPPVSPPKYTLFPSPPLFRACCELGVGARPGNDDAVAERRDALHDAHHVPLRILAIGKRLILVAERQRSEEDHPLVILGIEAAGRALRPGLLDDGEQLPLRGDVAEERLIGDESRILALRSQLVDPAMIGTRGRSGERQAEIGFAQCTLVLYRT